MVKYESVEGDYEEGICFLFCENAGMSGDEFQTAAVVAHRLLIYLHKPMSYLLPNTLKAGHIQTVAFKSKLSAADPFLWVSGYNMGLSPLRGGKEETTNEM